MHLIPRITVLCDVLVVKFMPFGRVEGIMAAQSSIPCKPEVRDRVRELKGERTYDELLKQLAELAEEAELGCSDQRNR